MRELKLVVNLDILGDRGHHGGMTLDFMILLTLLHLGQYAYRFLQNYCLKMDGGGINNLGPPTGVSLGTFSWDMP